MQKFWFVNKRLIFQFVSYFFVGLSAALVEWASFWFANEVSGFGIYSSTGLAFFGATAVNWILGRKTTFKEEAKKRKGLSDIFYVFLVSGCGLLFNLGLMRLFAVELGIYPLLAKIISTGCVFFWNFSMRKLFIYK